MTDSQRFALAGLFGSGAMVLGLVAFAEGCGFQSGLARAHHGLRVMSQDMEPKLAEECLRRARKCHADGIRNPGQCAPLVRCRTWKKVYAYGLKEVHKGLNLCNRTYIDMRQAGVFK